MNIIYGILMFAAGVLCVRIGVKTLRTSRASEKWPSTQGVVVRSGTKSQSGLDSPPSTIADVTYRYEVDGRMFESSRISLGQYGTGGGGHAKAEAAKYPAGANVTVFYDADKPVEAVLEPGGAVFFTFFILFFGAILLLAGAAFVLAGIGGMIS